MDELGDIVQEFLVESHENLDQLDRDLVALEQAPNSRALLSSIFRTIHTIKGTSGFLAFNRLERVTHVGESLLARLRDGAQAMTPADDRCAASDGRHRSQLLASIEANGADDGGDIESVIEQVTQCIANCHTCTARDLNACGRRPAPQPSTEGVTASGATAIEASASSESALPESALSSASGAGFHQAAGPASGHGTAGCDLAGNNRSTATKPGTMPPAPVAQSTRYRW